MSRLTNRTAALFLVALCFTIASANPFAFQLLQNLTVDEVSDNQSTTKPESCELLHPLCDDDSQCPLDQYCMKPWGICEKCSSCCDSLTENGCSNKCGSQHNEAYLCDALNFNVATPECIARTVTPQQNCALQSELRDIEDKFCLEKVIAKCLKNHVGVVGEIKTCQTDNFNEFARTCNAIGWDVCKLTVTYNKFKRMGVAFHACFVKSCLNVFDGLRQSVPSVDINIDCGALTDDIPSTQVSGALIEDIPSTQMPGALIDDIPFAQVSGALIDDIPSTQMPGALIDDIPSTQMTGPLADDNPSTQVPENRVPQAICAITQILYPQGNCDSYRIVTTGDTTEFSFSDKQTEMKSVVKTACLHLIPRFFDFVNSSQSENAQEKLIDLFANRELLDSINSNGCDPISATKTLHGQKIVIHSECLAPQGAHCQTIFARSNGTVALVQAHTRVTVYQPGKSYCLMVEMIEAEFDFRNLVIPENACSSRVSACPGQEYDESRGLVALANRHWKATCIQGLRHLQQFFSEGPKSPPLWVEAKPENM